MNRAGELRLIFLESESFLIRLKFQLVESERKSDWLFNHIAMASLTAILEESCGNLHGTRLAHESKN
jgi:hypothetical protein